MGACVSYQDFLDKKKLQPVISGSKAESLNNNLFDFQRVIVERALELWSAPDDLVFSPFLGVGSEGFCSVKMGRRFIGSELKPSYFDQAVKNMEDATRYNDDLFA